MAGLASERANTRAQLASLSAKLDANRADLADPNKPAVITEMLSSFSSTRLGEASHREINIDADNCVKISDAMGQMVRNINSGFKSWDIHGLLSGIKRKYAMLSEDDDTEASPDYNKMGRASRQHFQATPTIGFMLGPSNVQPKQRKPRQIRWSDKKPGPVKETEVVKSDDGKKKRSEAEIRLSHMSEVVLEDTRQHGGVGLFEMVINPRSFAQSVENLFDLSFLVNSGEVAISLNKNQPWLNTRFVVDEEGVKRDLQGERIPDDADNQQKNDLILKLDMEDWRNLKEAYEIRDARLGHREIRSTQ